MELPVQVVRDGEPVRGLTSRRLRDLRRPRSTQASSPASRPSDLATLERRRPGHGAELPEFAAQPPFPDPVRLGTIPAAAQTFGETTEVVVVEVPVQVIGRRRAGARPHRRRLRGLRGPQEAGVTGFEVLDLEAAQRRRRGGAARRGPAPLPDALRPVFSEPKAIVKAREAARTWWTRSIPPTWWPSPPTRAAAARSSCSASPPTAAQVERRPRHPRPARAVDRAPTRCAWSCRSSSAAPNSRRWPAEQPDGQARKRVGDDRASSSRPRDHRRRRGGALDRAGVAVHRPHPLLLRPRQAHGRHAGAQVRGLPLRGLRQPRCSSGSTDDAGQAR